MLSYRHSYHAGNFADVLKHTVQLAILDYLLLKEKPFCVIDTHAGAGAYKLDGVHARKTQEYLDGISRLWQAENLAEATANYVAKVKSFNSTDKLKTYPGSPWFSQQALRAGDKMFAYELHPSDFDLLTDFKGRDRKVKLFNDDGFKHCLGQLPPPQKRGMVIIDPPYEIKEDYQAVVDTVIRAHAKFANGIYAIWYPVVDRRRINRMQSELMNSGIKRIQCFELGVNSDSDEFGMTASGMIVINPPWTLMQQMQQALPQLVKLLANDDDGHYLAQEWVGE